MDRYADWHDRDDLSGPMITSYVFCEAITTLGAAIATCLNTFWTADLAWMLFGCTFSLLKTPP